jgi:hypothetical protein
MSMRRCLIVVWMVAGLQVLGMAQVLAPQDAPTQGSSDSVSRQAPATALSAIAGMQPDGAPETETSGLPLIPALLGGVGVSSNFLSELEKSNYLRGGVNVGAAYDDNPFLVASGATSNTSVSIFPNISVEESTSRVRWKLGYAGGLTINENLTNQNQNAQNVNFDSQYRLSPHVNLRAAENFSMTTGFFDSGADAGAVGSGGPNASLIAPLSTQRTTLTTVETNYHFALNDLVGASGSFYDLHFTNVPSGTQLTDSQTTAASTFWLHRLLGGDWGGVSYRFQRITFDPNGETRVNSFLVVDTLKISSRFTLTAFVGPQYLENQVLVQGATQVTQSNNWSVAAGIEGGWANQRTSATAGFSRNISDGGGLLGAVRLQTVHGTFRREFVPGWAAGVTGSYGTNQSLIVASPTMADSINLTTAGVSLERNVGKNIGLRLGYEHDFQKQIFPVPNPMQEANKNRFFVTLSYQWAKPLGM